MLLERSRIYQDDALQEQKEENEVRLIQRNPGTYYEVREPNSGKLRFETLYLPYAEDFATSVYKSDGTICEISEVHREQDPKSVN